MQVLLDDGGQQEEHEQASVHILFFTPFEQHILMRLLHHTFTKLTVAARAASATVFERLL